MRIGFIGAGKVGSGFGLYLRAKGMEVSGYFDLNTKTSEEASKAVGGQVFKHVDDLLKASDLVFITTHDDAIRTVCEEVVEQPHFCSAHMIAHMSGAADCSLLHSAANNGAEVFALHPLQAFVDPEQVVRQLESTYFGLEVDGEISVRLETFMQKIENPYFKLRSDQKANYHMAAVIVSNYMTTLMDFGLTIFEKAGIERDKGFDALMPLIQGALQNIANYGTQEALTGPIARGDATTISRHLEALGLDSESKEFYRFMGNETLKLAKKENLKDVEKIQNVQQLLEEEPVRSCH